MSLLEVVIASLILSVMVASVFDLFSMQRQQVSESGRGLLLHAYAVRRLAEEESRLNCVRFATPATVVTTTQPPGETFGFMEAMSVEPADTTTGLWKLTILLRYADTTATTSRSIVVTRLVVDRDRLTRLPASIRGAP